MVIQMLVETIVFLVTTITTVGIFRLRQGLGGWHNRSFSSLLFHQGQSCFPRLLGHIYNSKYKQGCFRYG